MTVEEYKEHTAQGRYIEAGSEAHELMHGAACEARRITCEINGDYRAPEQIRALFRALSEKRLMKDSDCFRRFIPTSGKTSP